LIVVCIPVSKLIGQNSDPDVPSFRERLFYGGNFGLQFGSVTDISISPIIGYWLFPRVSVAIGPEYRFYKFEEKVSNIVGAKLYTELYLVQDLANVIPIGANLGIFAHLEDEVLNIFSGSEGTYRINTVLLGGGISQLIGVRSSVNIMALWAVGGSGCEYYSNPEIRVVFLF
jgi:hypothetical protein